MSHNIHKEILSVTASSGSASINTNRFLNGLLREVISSPATSDTVYDITITSPEERIIYETLSQSGDLADEVVIPVRGIQTVSIANATVDEVFSINLVVDE